MCIRDRNREVAGINLKTNEIYHADYDFAKAKSAYIWKTIVDPFIGDVYKRQVYHLRVRHPALAQL